MFAAKLLTHMMVACLGTQVRKKAGVSKCKLSTSLLFFLTSMAVSEQAFFLQCKHFLEKVKFQHILMISPIFISYVWN